MQRVQLGGVETLVALMAASRRQADAGAESLETAEPVHRPAAPENPSHRGLDVSRCPFLSGGVAGRRRAPE